MGLTLFDFQKDAVKKAIELPKMLLCVRVGGGKTIISMVYAKNLLKRGLADKIVYACTVSAAVAVRGEYKDKGGINVPQYDIADDFIEWLRGPGKICVIKHSMFEKLGYDQGIIDTLREICSASDKRVALIVDEVHKISNSAGIANTALMNIKFCFPRMLLMTATPFSSDIGQMYGILNLIDPTLWKSQTAFNAKYIEQQTILVNGRVARREKIAYKNLADLREKITPFTFFYYPKIKLNFFQHNVVLNDYSEYDEICKGVLTAKDLEKLKGGNNV